MIRVYLWPLMQSTFPETARHYEVPGHSLATAPGSMHFHVTITLTRALFHTGPFTGWSRRPPQAAPDGSRGEGASHRSYPEAQRCGAARVRGRDQDRHWTSRETQPQRQPPATPARRPSDIGATARVHADNASARPRADAAVRDLALDRDAVRVTYWIAAGRRIILLTVSCKTRMRDEQEVARARRVMARCVAELHTADEEDDG